jgi:hypothetical protein
VHFEVSSVHFSRFGYSTREILTLLRDAGFSLYRAGAPREFTPITTAFDTAGFENLLALRDAGDFVTRTGWSECPARA